MRRFSNIDNEFVMKHELTLSEAYVLEWMLNLVGWADRLIINQQIYFFASKNKAVQDLPMVTKKTDTMYRHYKKLESKKLIKNNKLNGKDYIQILPLCSTWNQIRPSDSKPNESGFKSESDTESNPTNSNINSYSNLNNSLPSQPIDLFGEKVIDPKKKTLFKNCVYSDFNKFELKMKDAKNLGIDIESYHRAMDRWSRTSTTKRTADGWIATAETWMESDKDKGKLKMIKTDSQQTNEDKEAIEYLNTQ